VADVVNTVVVVVVVVATKFDFARVEARFCRASIFPAMLCEVFAVASPGIAFLNRSFNFPS
jgi:hypothetical protein